MAQGVGGDDLEKSGKATEIFYYPRRLAAVQAAAARAGEDRSAFSGGLRDAVFRCGMRREARVQTPQIKQR